MHILVTGASGSGTTTQGGALANRLGASHFDVDAYYWLPTNPPFTQKRAPNERLSLLLADLRTAPTAVVSGSVLEWGPEIEDAFDLIVFLYLETSLRIERLMQRELDRYGMIDSAFLEWASKYDEDPSTSRSLAKHIVWLANRACPVIDLRGDLSVSTRTATILDKMRDLFVLEPNNLSLAD